jgi:signal recognition particle receptor subunit beta
MVQFNFSERTIKAKVVYYGPPQSGKTTNLDQIHRLTDPEGTNRLISLNTAQDRTLFFDLLPFNLGTISGYDFKIQLYTVPGQVQYNATRRVVLAGADAVVFVADGQKTMARENLTAFENMKVNLLANRLVPEKVPLVLQYNKQDLREIIPIAELDRALNPWGRKAFPAVAARGEGVIETFVAMVQDMLTAIALKYNLKEKGLDPDAVPKVVNQAFASLLKQAPGPAPARAHSARMVIAQPEGAEPAYPGQAGAEASPVSEELLHRAIRSNVELAEAFGLLVREVNLGLATILSAASGLAAPRDDATRRTGVGTIQTEVQRLRRLVQELGQASANRGAGPARAPSPPQVPPVPARVATGPVRPPATAPPASARGAASVPPAPGSPALPPRPGAPVPPRPGAPAPPRPGAAPAVPVGPSPGTLDRLVEEVVVALRAAPAGPVVAVESKITRGTSLPRCSPAGLRRALLALLQGLGGSLVPGAAVAIRAERKPVLLRGRDGNEVRRDFLMVALTHASGLAEADQQRVLKGAYPGPLGEAYRLVRELGGFLRFAPLPAGALETRAFLPL